MKKLILVLVFSLVFGGSVVAFAEDIVEPVPEVIKKTTSGSMSHKTRAERAARLAAQNVRVWNLVKFGDRNETVKYFQLFLNDKGFNLVVDGIYGPKTLAAWSAYNTSEAFQVLSK